MTHARGRKVKHWLIGFIALGVAGCGDTASGPPEGAVPIESLANGAINLSLNPSGISPLTAEITFQTVRPVAVSSTVLGRIPLTVSSETATDHAIPVVGLYPGTLNQVELRLRDVDGLTAIDTLEIQTEALPGFLPTVDVVTAAADRMEPGWTLSSLSIGRRDVFESYPFMFDTDGSTRWFLDFSELDGIVFLVEPLQNGNLVLGHGHHIYELDRLGREVASWEMPGYWFHHDVVEKPDGNLLVAVDKGGEPTVEDHVIEIDRASGAVVNEWDLRESLDIDRGVHVDDPVDWFHMNAVWYDQRDGTVIVSGRNQSAVVKLTEANEVVWILAPHKGWDRAADGTDLTRYLLTAVDADGTPYPDSVQLGDSGLAGFRWSWLQHAPMILPNGDLFVFDNGADRNFGSAPLFSRGVEYRIDEGVRTVQQVWQYGQERGAEFFSPIISDVDYLPETGNRLIMPGIINGEQPQALVTEITHPGAEVVFEARILFKNSFSSGALQWGDFDLVYRSERLAP